MRVLNAPTVLVYLAWGQGFPVEYKQVFFFFFFCKSKNTVLSPAFQCENLGFVSYLDYLSSVLLSYLINVTSYLCHTGYVWQTSILVIAYCTVCCVLPPILKKVCEMAFEEL